MNTDLFDRLGVPERIREIAGYDLFDDDLRTSLDAIAKRSAGLLEAPVSMVSMVLDTSQFIIGSYGVSGWVADAEGTPAEWAMCTHTVLAGEPYCVVDGTQDPRHADNPFLRMTGLRSYLGVPLTRGGHALGAHCVIDARPRIFTDVDRAVLADGAEKVMKLLEAYRIT
ncbi:GAF domain-containing protein [Actinoplanes flavus]|uniref:GAF domain-containing protein n=1 Tax=Actinoplanes flavus TaxID=2820290 RepID=A0ABS3USR0_9ACTN|nr:GAF domain-containing protein [Actinoplanes flavus]MBO3741591.1 GAF domain-containing protein [Actinoplanes flavus]